MTSPRNVGRIIGLLLLVQMATGLIVPYVLLRPLTLPPAAFLESAAPLSSLVRLNVLFLFVGGALSVAISIAVWPFVRERNPSVGMWLLALALANFVLQLVENGHWLTLLSVSQAYVDAGAAADGRFEAIGIAVRSAWKWAHYVHIAVVVGWLFTLFLTVHRAALAPRALGVLGMSLCALHTFGITLPVFGGYRMPYPMLFGMPLAFGILALATWLMARGLRDPDGAALAPRGRA